MAPRTKRNPYPIGRVSFPHAIPTGAATGGHVITVTVWYSDVYGLVVHESLPSNMGGKWAVSHTRSGYAIGFAKSWESALTLAGLLGECGSWNRDIDDIKGDTRFRAHASDIILEYGVKTNRRTAASVWG